jgi:hypothetical protein
MQVPAVLRQLQAPLVASSTAVVHHPPGKQRKLCWCDHPLRAMLAVAYLTERKNHSRNDPKG